MTQNPSFVFYTFANVETVEEPRWKDTGIPETFYETLEDARSEVAALRADLMAGEHDEVPPMQIERIETLPMSKANVLTLLNDGVGACLKSYEIVEVVE